MRVDALAETVRWLSLTERPGETWDTLRCREAMFPGRGSGPCILPGNGAQPSASTRRLHLRFGRKTVMPAGSCLVWNLRCSACTDGPASSEVSTVMLPLCCQRKVTYSALVRGFFRCEKQCINVSDSGKG